MRTGGPRTTRQSTTVRLDRGIGTLAERGAQWLFMRYLVDQFAAGNTRDDWNTLTRLLVQTSRSGAANVEAVTGVKFDSIVSRWALANWVTDISGAPPELKYESWNLHAVYSSLHTQRPQLFQQVGAKECRLRHRGRIAPGRLELRPGTAREVHRARRLLDRVTFGARFPPEQPFGQLRPLRCPLGGAARRRLDVVRLLQDAQGVPHLVLGHARERREPDDQDAARSRIFAVHGWRPAGGRERRERDASTPAAAPARCVDSSLPRTFLRPPRF